MGSGSTLAGMISSCELDSVDLHVTSLDMAWLAGGPLLGGSLWESDGWGDRALNNSIAIPPSIPSPPAPPLKQLPAETPLLDLEAPASSSGSGVGTSGSSSGGSTTTSLSAAVFTCNLMLSPPTLVGWLQTREVDDIPPAPPFELLRPPQSSLAVS